MRILIIGENKTIEKQIGRILIKNKIDVHYLIHNKEEVSRKRGKSYSCSLDSSEIHKLYKQKKFDQIIYFESENNEQKLNNLLNLSSKYNIPFFIYISSIYTTKNQNDLLICDNWRATGLSICCLKYTNIYGYLDQTMSPIDRLIFHILDKSKKASIGQTVYDYIYIDDAINHFVNIIRQPSNNNMLMYSNQSYREQDLQKIIYTIQVGNNLNSNQYLIKTEDLFSSTERQLDYYQIPETSSFSQNVKKTYERIAEKIALRKINQHKSKSLIRYLKKIGSIMSPYIINLLCCLSIIFISNITRTHIDIKLLEIIYIVMMGLIYGTRQSVLSAFLVCMYTIVNSSNQGISILNLFSLNDSLVQLMMYFLIGIVVGYYTDNRRRQNKNLSNSLKRQEQKYLFLKDLYEETYDHKKELEQKVLGSKNSVAKVYEAVRELQSLSSDYILKNVTSIFENFLGVKNVTTYIVRNNYMRLNTKSNPEIVSPFGNGHLSQIDTQVFQLLKRGELFMNYEMKSNLPSALIPIMKFGRLEAVICLAELRFEQMNLYTKNKLQVLMNLIQLELNKAYEFEKRVKSNHYIDGTSFLKPDSLDQVITVMDEFKSRGQLNYACIKIKQSLDLKLMSTKLKKCIRDTDYLGIDSNGMVNIILLNASSKDADLVMKRFQYANLDYGREGEIYA